MVHLDASVITQTISVQEMLFGPPTKLECDVPSATDFFSNANLDEVELPRGICVAAIDVSGAIPTTDALLVKECPGAAPTTMVITKKNPSILTQFAK